MTAVSRSPDKLDVFVVGTDGGIWTAACSPATVPFEGGRGSVIYDDPPIGQ